MRGHHSALEFPPGIASMNAPPLTQWFCDKVEDGDIELVADENGETLHFDTTQEEYTKVVETAPHHL